MQRAECSGTTHDLLERSGNRLGGEERNGRNGMKGGGNGLEHLFKSRSCGKVQDAGKCNGWWNGRWCMVECFLNDEYWSVWVRGLPSAVIIYASEI